MDDNFGKGKLGLAFQFLKFFFLIFHTKNPKTVSLFILYPKNCSNWHAYLEEQPKRFGRISKAVPGRIPIGALGEISKRVPWCVQKEFSEDLPKEFSKEFLIDQWSYCRNLYLYSKRIFWNNIQRKSWRNVFKNCLWNVCAVSEKK